MVSLVPPADRALRHDAVRQVLYLMFNEKFATTSGQDVVNVDCRARRSASRGCCSSVRTEVTRSCAGTESDVIRSCCRTMLCLTEPTAGLHPDLLNWIVLLFAVGTNGRVLPAGFSRFGDAPRHTARRERGSGREYRADRLAAVPELRCFTGRLSRRRGARRWGRRNAIAPRPGVSAAR